MELHIVISRAAAEEWNVGISDGGRKLNRYTIIAKTEREALDNAIDQWFGTVTPPQPTQILWLDDARVTGLQQRVKAIEAKVGLAWPDVAKPPTGVGYE